MTEMERDPESLATQVAAALTGQGLDVEHDAARSALRIRWFGGDHLFQVVVTPTLRPADALLRPPPSEDAILLTRHVSSGLASALARAGWSGWADLAGNARLDAAGLTIRIKGNRPETPAPRTPSRAPFTRSGLPVTLALLTHRESVPTQRELAGLAGASLGTVNRVLTALRDGTPTQVDPSGGLLRPDDLAERWIAAYLSTQPEAWPTERFSSDRWGSPTAVDPADLPEGTVIGSELGAALTGQPIRPATALLHVPADQRREVIRQGRLRADPEGQIGLRPAPWAAAMFAGQRVAPAVLLRADLMLEDDPRLDEIAARLRDA